MVTRKKKVNRGQSIESLPIPMPHLPEEIIVGEILWRLPVKSLIRFRSVCKYWNSLIASDSEFAVLQLKNSIKTNLNRQRLLIWASSSIFVLDHRPLTNNFTIEKLKSPITDGSALKPYSMLAACDGMVCVRKCGSNVILLWNSLTGETRRVLQPPSKLAHRFAAYGLGYDPCIDNYKLFRICGDRAYLNEVRVCSLRNNSWRRIQDLTYGIQRGSSGLFLNGALYWIAHFRNSPHNLHILSFDVVTEKYRELGIPDMGGRPYPNFVIGVLHRKLCIYYHSNEQIYTLWLMGEYDNAESWIKYEITSQIGSRLTPKCVVKNGEGVLFAVDEKETRFCVYHLKDCTFTDLHIPGLPARFWTMTFSESLISPNSFKGINI